MANSNFCACKSGGENLGKAVCDTLMDSWFSMLFKERINANGAVAGIDFTTPPANDAFFATYLQALPKRNRYFVGLGIDDYTFEQQDREVVTTANAVSYKVRDGHTEITYNILEASPEQYRRYKALECLKLGINPIDQNGVLWGIKDGNILRTIPIDSFAVKYAPNQNSGVVSHVIVTFNIPHTTNAGQFKGWVPSSTDANPLEFRDIVDVTGSGLTATNASANVGLTLSQASSSFGALPFVGAELSNFTATVNGSPAVITSVNETSDGVYAFVMANALATTETLVISFTAVGFEMSPVSIVVA